MEIVNYFNNYTNANSEQCVVFSVAYYPFPVPRSPYPEVRSPYSVPRTP